MMYGGEASRCNERRLIAPISSRRKPVAITTRYPSRRRVGAMRSSAPSGTPLLMASFRCEGWQMPRPQRKKNEDPLLLALACGATVEAAARQCGLSDRTVYRRLEDPEFKKRLDKVRADMVERSSAMLTAAAGEAVRTLLALQKDSTPAAVRLGAARAILEVGIKVRQMVELEQRMAELEAMVATQDTGGSWNR